MLFVARFLTADGQGWYYSFLVIASPYLFDLGLSSVLVQVAAHFSIQTHESAAPAYGMSSGPRVIWLCAAVVRWYALVAMLCVVLLIAVGFIVFGPKADAVVWLPTWLVLVVLSALGLFVIPQMSIAEGMGRIQEVYKVRLIQGIAGSSLCWLTLYVGGALWAVVMPAFAAVLVPTYWLYSQRAWAFPKTPANFVWAKHWRTEIWPLQWRLALNLLSGFLLTQIYTPILFHYQGGRVAGQMGLSLAIANTVGLIAQSWHVRHVPAMGSAVARQDWESLDRLFYRDFGISSLLFLMGAAFLIAVRSQLQGTSIHDRLLPLNEFTMLFGVVFANHVMGALAMHLRSFRREPLMWVSVIGVVIAVPVGLIAARMYSSLGVVVTMLVVTLILEMPVAIWLWRRLNVDFRK